MLNWRKFIVTGALATTLTFSSISAMAVSFDDVSGSESEMSITKLVSMGIIVNNGTYFNPEDGLSRLEYADIASRIMTLSPAKAMKIKDVSTVKGKNTNVVRALQSGIVSLNSKGEFKPQNSVYYRDFVKALAYGLGFKKTWSNRPIDHLYFLERKGVLSIDTDLDAVVTREEAAVAVDKYLQVKDAYITVTGVVSELTSNGFKLKNESGVKLFKLNSKASLFIDGQAAELGNFASGTEVNVIVNKKSEVVFVAGDGIEVFDGKLAYTGGNLTINGAVKNFNLNAVVAALPNSPTAAFTFTEFSNYASKAGVSFEGSLYNNTVTDQITKIEAYVSKVADRAVVISGNKVTVAFDDLGYKSQSFNINEEAKFTLVDGETKTEVKLADLTALQTAGKVLTGTLLAGPDGTVTSIEVKAAAPAAK